MFPDLAGQEADITCAGLHTATNYRRFCACKAPATWTAHPGKNCYSSAGAANVATTNASHGSKGCLKGVASVDECKALCSHGCEAIVYFNTFCCTMKDVDLNKCVASVYATYIKESLGKTSGTRQDSGEASWACQAELYQHADFAGWKTVFPIGDYTYSKFIMQGATNDDVSSLRVVGSNCIAEVYQHGDFTGWKATFATGDYNYDAFLGRGAKKCSGQLYQSFRADRVSNSCRPRRIT